MMPHYGGKVLIAGSNGEELSIPYSGAAFDLKSSLRQRLPRGPPRSKNPARTTRTSTHTTPTTSTSPWTS